MRAPPLLSILRPGERRQLAGLALLIVVTAALEAASVTAIYPFLVVATSPNALPAGGSMARLYALSGAASPRAFLLLLGTTIFVLVLLASLVGAFTTWRQQRFVRDFEHGLSVRLLRHFLGQPYGYFLTRNTAELQRRLLSDPRNVSDGALDPALEMIQRGVTALAIFGVLLVLQPVIALSAVALFGVVYLLLYRAGRRRLQDAGARVEAASRRAAKASAEALSAIKALKVTRREDHFVRHYEAEDATVSTYRARHAMYLRLPRYFIEGLTFAFLMGVILLILASGRDLLGILPTLGMFAFAGFRLMPAVHGIVSSAGRLRFGQAVVEAVAADLATPPPAQPPADLAPLPLARELALDRLTFAYAPGAKPVLDEISLRVPKGTSVGFVGRTGSGKTTTLDLLLGLLRPTSGSVLVDGAPLDDERVARWQRNVAYVPQQIVLLDDTITRNIAFGVADADIDAERVRAAAKAANVLDFIEKELPGRFETVVGERGVRLSGGQRQRIGIARALYEDKEVIVFDEATSEVDAVTERAINDAIAAMARRKTVIVVAHRFSAIRACDQVVLLDAGRVVAAGSYDELLRTNERFRAMAAGQA